MQIISMNLGKRSCIIYAHVAIVFTTSRRVNSLRKAILFELEFSIMNYTSHIGYFAEYDTR